MCHSLAGAIDQYFGRSQVARIVSIRSNGLKAITVMQYSSHAGLSQSGCHLESPMNKRSYLFSSITAPRATNGSSKFWWYLLITLSRSAFSGERKEVNISRLTCYKQFESKQKGTKPHDGLANAAMGAAFPSRKKQRPADSGRALQ